MIVTLYETKPFVVPTVEDLPWNELVSALSADIATPCDPCQGRSKRGCRHKSGQGAWSPVRIEGNRLDVNVRAVTALVLDLDHLPRSALVPVAEAIDGLSFVLHSTHSHRHDGPDDQALRLVIELDREVPAAQWDVFLATVVELLGFEAWTDKTCKNLSRLYFLPSHPASQEALIEVGTGEPLSVDEVLRHANIDTTRSPSSDDHTPAFTGSHSNDLSDLRTGDVPEGSEEVDLVALIKRVRELRSKYKREEDDRAALMTAVLDGTELAPPQGGQAHALHRAASALGTGLPAGTPSSAALEILRRSINSMGHQGEGLDYWYQKAIYSFDRAMEYRIEQDRKRDEVNTRLRGKVKLAVDKLRPHKEPDRVVTPSSTREPAATESVQASETLTADGLEEWTTRLLWKPVTKAENEPKLEQVTYNAVELLTNMPEWKDVLRFNELTKDIEIHGDNCPLPPEQRHVSTLSTAISTWLQSNAGLNIPDHTLRPVILLVARQKAYDPLYDYLSALEWDGVPRIDDMLIKYFSVATLNAAGEDITDHVKRISRRWAISAVARGLSPGCKVDTVLVLEGLQGISKSSVFDTLGGRFFADSQLILGDKDSKMLAARSWIIELSEMASFQRSEPEAVKGFLTARKDSFRPPYGSAIEDSPRRCVFVATINPHKTYMDDPTGNRRYWAVTCGTDLDLLGVDRDRDQIWAEAVYIYKAARDCHECEKERAKIRPDSNLDPRCSEHRWWLDKHEAEIAEEQAKERTTEPDTMLATLQKWWYTKDPTTRPAYIRVSEAICEAMVISADKVSRSLETTGGQALRLMGFRHARPYIHGLRAWVYVPSDELRTASRIGPGSKHLTSIPGGKVASI